MFAKKDKRIKEEKGRFVARRDIKEGETPIWFPFGFYHSIPNESRDGVVANCMMNVEKSPLEGNSPMPFPMPGVLSAHLTPIKNIKKGELITYKFTDPELSRYFSTPLNMEKK